MRNECTICENDSLMRLAELEIENERLRDWRYRLEQALEHNYEMIKALREENEEQANKLRIYQEHCKKEKSENSDDDTDYKLPEEDCIFNDLAKIMELGKN